MPTAWSYAVAATAQAIAEPARVRMLDLLLDGSARTATELALAGGVTPSTASTHLHRLESAGLVTRAVQGKHRYFRLAGAGAARALEALGVLAGAPQLAAAWRSPERQRSDPAGNRSPHSKRPTGATRAKSGEPPPAARVPDSLRLARTCYDHIAGRLGVALHDRLLARGWLAAYQLTPAGRAGLHSWGVDIAITSPSRRRFAFACLDWSERRPHLAGALGSALLAACLRQRWLRRELDSRALEITPAGRRRFAQFGISL
ncbi:MAG: ArsR family transcriptional regulator [Acidobacteria bacterium]|nr:MAG: ArsR family transcriptional regulator [Acidobacteriota bacterium]